MGEINADKASQKHVPQTQTPTHTMSKTPRTIILSTLYANMNFSNFPKKLSLHREQTSFFFLVAFFLPFTLNTSKPPTTDDSAAAAAARE